jgi:putative hemolysin
MLTVAILLIVCLSLLLILATFVQLLYLESMRLRSRETPALTHFKEELEAQIGLEGEAGALSFALIKHTSILMLGGLVTMAASRPGVPWWSTVLEAILFGWAGLVACAYLIPQILYKRTSGHWVGTMMPLLRVLLVFVRPFTLLVSLLQSLFDFANSGNGREEETDESGHDHIEAFIDAGTEEGILEEGDRQLVHSAVTFGDKSVRMAMTPRPKIVAIQADATLAALRNLVINQRFSRIPVYEDSIDDIVGFVHVRDMFEIDNASLEEKHVRDILRPIRSVPETKAIDDLFREMQQNRSHMVAVIDEYGNTAGLVTVEDLVEELVGEIRDEHEPTHDVTREQDGSIVVSGSYDLDGLAELLAFRPDSETESTTVGGLAAEWLGRVPAKGESVAREGIRIEVLAGNELRVDKVRISKTEDQDEDGINQPE